MDYTVKLTLRLPSQLHERLKQKALNSDRSLNNVIVDALRVGLEINDYKPESREERVWRALRESGLWEPLGAEWNDLIEDAPVLTHAELREQLKGVPPLSEAIIDEREPRE